PSPPEGWCDMAKKTLRAVADDERPPEPVKVLTLLEAVEGGSVLEILLAQRRLIANALTTAAENTRPQFNNELNKLHALIAAEEARLVASAEQDAAERGIREDEPFDASAV
ncbi:MAG: hypothetical protein ACREUF_08720, partial [Solimonas sp.]